MKDKENDDFKITLEAARVNAGKNQRDMANLLDITVQTYIKLEKNPSKITYEQGKKISNFLNIPQKYIIFLP